MLLFALLSASCGGGGDEAGGGSASSTTPGATTTLVIPSTFVPSSSTVASSIVSTSTSAPGSTSTMRDGGALSATSTVDLRGLGPVRVGMTLAEASDASGTRIVARPGSNGDCGFAEAEGGPEGVAFMTASGRIARVDVTAGPVRTRSGAGVGDTEAQVQARYSDRLQVSPHKYLPTGRYLTLVPSDSEDSGFRLIFETDGGKVARFRAGKQPEVSYVEGCG